MRNLRHAIIEETVINAFSNKKDGYASTYSFYFHMFAMCNIVETEEVPLAGVNFERRWNIFINPKEFSKYPLNVRLGIIKHEMLHIILNHLIRVGDRNRKKWNLATDCAINQMIDSNDLPKDNINPESLSKSLGIKVPKNLSAEEYYELIKQNPSSDDGDDGEGEGGKHIEGHSIWGECSDTKGLEEVIENSVQGMVKKAQDKNRGLVPHEINEIIELMFRKAKVNWKQVLRNIVSNKKVDKRYTIMKRNRRFPRRTEIRGTTKNRLFNIVVFLDISGSMSDDEILMGLDEIREITRLTNSKLKIIQIDTKVQEVDYFDKNTRTFNRRGMGGTMMFPGLEYIKEHKIKMDCGILISDMNIEPLSVWDDKEVSPKCKFIFLETSEESLKNTTSKKNYLFFKLN